MSGLPRRIVLLLVLASCKEKPRSTPVRATASPTASGPTMPVQPTGECLNRVNGVCTVQAYTPQETLAMYSATSMRQAGSELGTSCTLVRDGVCTEGIYPEVTCTGARGVFRRAPCATETALGTCRFADGTAVVTELHNGRNLSVRDLRDDCTSASPKATWIAGPKETEGATRLVPLATRISGSCAMGDSCRDYSVEDVSARKATCSGTWLDEPCETAKLAGSCVWGDGMTERYYAAKRIDKARLARECERVDAATAALGTLGTGVWIAAP